MEAFPAVRQNTFSETNILSIPKAVLINCFIPLLNDKDTNSLRATCSQFRKLINKITLEKNKEEITRFFNNIKKMDGKKFFEILDNQINQNSIYNIKNSILKLTKSLNAEDFEYYITAIENCSSIFVKKIFIPHSSTLYNHLITQERNPKINHHLIKQAKMLLTFQLIEDQELELAYKATHEIKKPSKMIIDFENCHYMKYNNHQNFIHSLASETPNLINLIPNLCQRYFLIRDLVLTLVAEQWLSQGDYKRATKITDEIDFFLFKDHLKAMTAHKLCKENHSSKGLDLSKKISNETLRETVSKMILSKFIKH